MGLLKSLLLLAVLCAANALQEAPVVLLIPKEMSSGMHNEFNLKVILEMRY